MSPSKNAEGSKRGSVFTMKRCYRSACAGAAPNVNRPQKPGSVSRGSLVVGAEVSFGFTAPTPAPPAECTLVEVEDEVLGAALGSDGGGTGTQPAVVAEALGASVEVGAGRSPILAAARSAGSDG